MQQFVNEGFDKLKTHPIRDILLWVSESNMFKQEEKNIIIFEIGRKYGENKC